MDDLYKQNNNRVHWVLFNIPATVTHLDKNTSLPDNAISAHNSWSKTGYKGPCSLRGIHPYIFTLYALDTRLTVNSNSNKSDILNAMQNHVLDTATLIGLYE
jgi:Raf kinase inhibitor-like YbhB/YbcL family protein